MRTTKETSHTKNAVMLGDYISYLGTLGATYSTSMATLSVANLGTVHVAANAKLQAVIVNEEVWKNVTNNREIEINKLGPLSLRLQAALKATSASRQTIEDFHALVNKLRGTTKKSKAPAEAKTADGLEAAVPARTHSSSQLSFNKKIEHFTKMIQILQSVADYAPSGADLQIAALQALLARLIALNTEAGTAQANLKASRIDRNQFFYTPETGMLDLVKKSKAVILSIFGANSQQYKTAVSYKFVQAIRPGDAN